jgi:type IV pilus assembly protein PilA
MKRSAQKGFTLIELLVVIGILAILFSIVLIAINPSRQFGQANDTKKRSDTLQVLNAIHQYAAEHSGNLPVTLTSPFVAADISNTAANICADLMPTYISALPSNPSGTSQGVPITSCTTYDTGYMVAVDAAGRVTVSAGNDINGNPITITR